jgi:hypothetical protein
MSIHLVTKKFPSLQRNCHEQKGYSSLCSYEKNNYLRQRLFKTFRSRKPKLRSFRTFWFCNTCYATFSLKPLKKYKTLQKFPLQCPKCKSEKIARNSDLVNAIVNKKPLDVLLHFSDENSLEIECKIKDFEKYHLELNNNNLLQKLSELTITLN